MGHDPRSVPGYWLTWLDINDPGSANYKRASTGGRCHPKRWDRDQYKDAIVRDHCPDLIPCTPKESCLGNNTCESAYQWTLQQCQAKRQATDDTTGGAGNLCK